MANENSSLKIRQFLGQVIDYQLLKTDPAPWNWLFVEAGHYDRNSGLLLVHTAIERGALSALSAMRI
jgi:hypothetical protein